MLKCRLLCAGKDRCPAGLQRNGFQLLAPVAFTTEIEDRGIIKDTVQSAQKRVVLIEHFPPEGRVLVAGKDQVESAIFVVAAVNGG